MKLLLKQSLQGKIRLQLHLQPSFQTSQLNSFPAVRFDGSDAMTAVDIISGNIGRTTFIVGKVNANESTSGFIEFNKDWIGGSGENYLIRGEVAVHVSGNIIYNENFGTSNYRILTVRNASGA
ncbi:unnamed protein product, partial [marine sediment metagenome]